MSEWLLFSTNSANFQAILWPEQVNFNEMMEEVRFVLDQHVYLNFYSVTHWNNRPRIDMSPGKSWSYLPLQPAVFWVQTPEVECVCDIMAPFPMMQQDKYRKHLQRRMVCTRSGGYHVKYLHKVKVKIFYITIYGQSNYIVKPAHVVTSIKQSPVANMIFHHT
jgi:hypothetical protein